MKQRASSLIATLNDEMIGVLWTKATPRRVAMNDGTCAARIKTTDERALKQKPIQ